MDTFRRRRRLRRVSLLATIVTPIATGLAMFMVVTADPAPVSGAGTLTVTNCHDSGAGSLRADIASATAGDTVNFFVSCPATSPITLASTLDINTNVNISGPGASRLVVSGNNAVEDFNVASGVTATISGITIEDGNTFQGGGIYNDGTLNVTDSTISGNSAGTMGGGIYNQGTLTVNGSTLSGNKIVNGDGSSGGGIYNQGTLTLTDSTLASNTAPNGWGAGLLTAMDSETKVVGSTFSDNVASVDGGGIFNYGTLTVSASTFSGNEAVNGDGGGIYNFYQETMSVSDSTLSGNVAGFNGGGIVNEGGSMTVTSSTLSGNSGGTSGSDIAGGSTTTVVEATILANGKMNTDCSGDITDGGYNLDDDTSCSFSPVNHSQSGVDPDLGPLQDNGGPTDTLLPALTSPAVGVIPNQTTLNGVQVCPRVDQRGVASVGNCTIGAVEVTPCTAGLHAHVLSATYASGTFTGLFCVNAKGIGTYTQGAVSGFGSVTVVKGTTVISALGKDLFLAGSTNGTKSSFVESAPAPIKLGTFTLSSTAPTQAPSLGSAFIGNCAVPTTGGVACWGDGETGSLGNGSFSDSATPVSVEGVGGSGTLTSVSSLQGSTFDYCALLSSGGVDCWGDGGSGELGNGSMASSDVPVQVDGVGGTGTLSGVASIVSGGPGYCALLRSGSVDCWGNGNDGELGDGDFAVSAVPVQVEGVGGKGDLSGVTGLSSDGAGYCAVSAAAGVYCWGLGTGGQLGDGVFASSSTPVAVGGIDGIGTLSDVSRLSSDSTGYCALLTSGGADCWGKGSQGGLGDGNSYGAPNYGSAVPVAVEGVGGVGTLSDVLSLTGDIPSSDSGDDGYCAVLTTGGVACWGYGATGEIGNGTYYNCEVACGPTAPASVIGAGGTGYLTGVASMTSDGSGYCALLTAGGVDCWGDGLGPTSGGGSAAPVEVLGIGGDGILSGVTAVLGGGADGRETYCAALTSGDVDCWGSNDLGQLGSGVVFANSITPVMVLLQTT